jgi:hypothetical protein
MELQRPMRPRAKSGFSITSNKSDGTSKSKEGKFRESHDQKNHLSDTTKANPNAAMNELQPMQQQLESATIGSLRGGQYTDVYGAPITDPDLSNPTRRRTERPLETIRSFEAAIDNSAPEGYDSNSRRSSSYWGGGYDQAGAGSRFSQMGGSNVGGYYNHRGNRDSYADNGGRGRYNRQQSDSALNRYNHNAQGVYPTPHYGQSSATVNTGESSGSASDQWQQSTEPSSESSSIDRDAQHGYPPHGHPGSRQPIAEEGSYTYGNENGNGHYHNGYANGPPVGLGNYRIEAPPVPPKMSSSPPAPRQPIKLDQTSSGGPVGGRPSLNDNKRKSWLRRTFSKGG